VLEVFFRAQGFAVHSVFSGEEALTRLADDPPEVMLLDILLPGLSGLEVLKRAKQLHPPTRIIMVTGMKESDLRAAARQYGAAAYVTKPFDFSSHTWSAALAYPY
jgi:DNA-binding response OmpR family regulator